MVISRLENGDCLVSCSDLSPIPKESLTILLGQLVEVIASNKELTSRVDNITVSNKELVTSNKELVTSNKELVTRVGFLEDFVDSV